MPWQMLGLTREVLTEVCTPLGQSHSRPWLKRSAGKRQHCLSCHSCPQEEKTLSLMVSLSSMSLPSSALTLCPYAGLVLVLCPTVSFTPRDVM